MRRETLAHLLLTAVVLVWGVTFVLVKGALAQATPLAFVLARMSLAALALALVWGARVRQARAAEWGWGALAGFFLGSGYCLQTAGLRSTTPSRSAFLTGAVVLFVPVLSLVPALRVPGAGAPRLQAFVGAGLGFCGLVLLAAPAGSLGMGAVGRGEWLTLGCAFAYALHLLTLAHGSPRMHYGTLAVLQISFAALTTVVLLPFVEPQPRLPLSASVLLALAVAALLATAAAFAIQSWAQQFLPPTHTALILTLEPVFAALTSALVLGERLGARGLAGAGLVLLGILLAELAPAGVQPTAHEAGAPTPEQQPRQNRV